MSNNEVKIKISVNGETHEIVSMKDEVNKLGKSFNDADSAADKFRKKIELIGTGFAGFHIINQTLGKVVSTGFEASKTFQDLTNSLTMSIAATSSNISTTGRMLEVQEKYSMANKDAIETLTALQKASLNTTLSFEQNTKIYDTMYISMKKAGASASDMVDIVEKLSIAVGSKMDFSQIVAGVDGLASGTVAANSDLGRFLSAIGLTNEALKNSANVVDLVKEKLAGFESLDSYSAKVAKLDASFSELSKSIMKMPFESVENSINKTTSTIDAMTEAMNSVNKYFSDNNINIVNEVLKVATAVGGSVVAFKTLSGAMQTYTKLTAPAVYETKVLNGGLTLQKVLVKESGVALFKKELALKATTLASTTLSTALRAIPFFAATSLVYGLTTAFQKNAEKGKLLENIYAGIKTELDKLTISQLKYQKSTIDKGIVEVYGEYDAAYRKALKSGSLEDKNKRDELKANYDLLIAERDRYNEAIEKSKSPKKNETLKSDYTDQFNSAQKLINEALNPMGVKIDEIKEKYRAYFELYKKEGKDTAELQKAMDSELLALQDKKIKDTEKGTKAIKDEESALRQLESAYNDIAQIGMSAYEKQVFAITQKSQEWTKAGVDMNTVLQAQSTLLDELSAKQILENTSAELEHYSRLVNLKQDNIEKDLELASIAFSQKAIEIQSLDKPIEDKTRLLELETEIYEKTLERINLENELKQIDENTNSMTQMLDDQLALIDSTNSWNNSLTGVGQTIGNLGGAFTNLAKLEINQEKQKIKARADYDKAMKKAGKDEAQRQKAEQKYNQDIRKLEDSRFEAQLSGYSSLLGASASFFDEESDAYKVLTGLQIGLEMAIHATALAKMLSAEATMTTVGAETAATFGLAGAKATESITTAGTGDPYTAAARVVAMISLMASAMSMFGSGGASGGGASAPSATEINKFNIEAQYNPALDKLDRQIELLEAIERNGSAGALRVEKSAVTFERDYKLFVNESLSELHDYLKSSWGKTNPRTQAQADVINKGIGADIFSITPKGDTVYNKNALREGYNFMKLIEESNKEMFQVNGGLTSWAVLFDANWSKEAGDPASQARARIAKFTNEFQEILSDYTMSLLDSMNEITDARDKFEDYYDAITGTDLFKTKKLDKAFKDVEELLNGRTLADYFVEEIDNINALKAELTDEKIAILLMEDPTRLQEQLDILDDLQNKTGLVFDNGIESALNYLDAIDLVADTMTTSRKNIDSFLNSFRTDSEKLSISAMNLNVTVASTLDQLASQFVQFRDDALGLTDERLAYLESAKAHIENLRQEENDREIANIEAQIDALEAEKEALEEQKNLEEERYELEKKRIEEEIKLNEEALRDLKSNISKLENIIKSMNSTIDKLKGNVQGSSYTLEKFYASMNQSLSLSKTKDYEALQESVKDTISYSNALFEKQNFASSWDMEYAQLTAANQFESIQMNSQTEIDYLRMIEENTANTVLGLKASLENMTANFNAQIEGFNSLIAELGTKIGNLNSSVSSMNNQNINISIKEFEDAIKKTETTKKEEPKPVLPTYGKPITPVGVSQAGMNAVYDIYSKYDLHQFQVDSSGQLNPSGYANWAKLYDQGHSLKDIDLWIKQAARENLLKQNTEQAKKWLSTYSFAVGTTNVPYDMLAQIHQGEAIIPKTFADGLKSGELNLGNNQETIKLLEEIRTYLAKLDRNVENIDDRNEYKLRQESR